MPELKILRVEVSNVGVEDEGSLKSGKGSTGKSLAAGGVGGVAGSQLSSEKERTRKGDKILESIYPDVKRTPEQLKNDADMKALLGYERPSQLSMKTKRKVQMPTGKQVGGAIGTVVAAGTAVFSVYSNNKQASLGMSGATHAAAMQGRTKDSIDTSITMGLSLAALGYGIATGNPIAAIAGVVGMVNKVITVVEGQRKEMFDIQKTQVLAQISQRNLVRTVAERRF